MGDPAREGEPRVSIARAAGGVVREERVETSRLSLMQQQGRRHHDLAVTAPGTYRVQCEIDGLALPEAEVEARLRETVEVELKPAP
jgi:hypothetical protein